MSYAIIRDGKPVEVVPRDGGIEVNGVIHPVAILSIWPEKDLRRIGLRPIKDTPVPAGKVSTGYTLVLDAGEVTRVHTLVDAPPPPVPESITPLQGRKALRAAGVFEAFKAFEATLTDEQRDELEYALQWSRDNPIIAAGAASLGLTSQQVDDLFRLAATL